MVRGSPAEKVKGECTEMLKKDYEVRVPRRAGIISVKKTDLLDRPHLGFLPSFGLFGLKSINVINVHVVETMRRALKKQKLTNSREHPLESVFTSLRQMLTSEV